MSLSTTPRRGGPAEILPVVDVVVVAGPPVIFVMAPWLAFGLLLAAPVAVAVALTLIVVAATLALAAAAALVALPFVLLGRLRHRRPLRPVATPAIRLSAARLWPAGA